jgi:hypothetical protein
MYFYLQTVLAVAVAVIPPEVDVLVVVFPLTAFKPSPQASNLEEYSKEYFFSFIYYLRIINGINNAESKPITTTAI